MKDSETLRGKVNECLDNIRKRNFDIVIINRKEYWETLNKYNLTPKIVKEVIDNLGIENYYRGPFDPDDNSEGEIWEFGMDIDGNEFYIKICIICRFGKIFVKCISFHIPDYPIIYPLKGCV